MLCGLGLGRQQEQITWIEAIAKVVLLEKIQGLSCVLPLGSTNPTNLEKSVINCCS